MGNLVVHFEIHGSEPQKLVDFYSGLLGWTFMGCNNVFGLISATMSDGTVGMGGGS